MKKECLQIVLNGIIMSKLMYGIVIWGSNVNLCEKNKINNILKSAFRAGFMDKKIDFTELLTDREIHILRNLENNNYNAMDCKIFLIYEIEVEILSAGINI
jgi:hypothetical protein